MNWDKDIINKKAEEVGTKELSQDQIQRNLRAAVSAEYGAIDLYVSFMEGIKDQHIIDVFNDIIKEEKRHVGQFSELLASIDAEQGTEMEEGKKEVETVVEKS